MRAARDVLVAPAHADDERADADGARRGGVAAAPRVRVRQIVAKVALQAR